MVLAFDDNRLASQLFGQYGQNLALIERRLGVVAEQRGNHVTVAGSRDAMEQARRVLEGLYERLKRGDELVSGDVDGAIRLAIAQGSLFDYDPATARPSFEEINLRKRPVRARTAAQDAYIRALRRHALVFGTGPAGTGKTWLAVAHAVQLFERKEVDRIILSRPAVEAGERLGFLPGDMREKVDPYLRPIYDALYDLMDARIVERAMQTGEIEIAPLAFMRGRTLVERRGDPRRGAEYDLDADEDVPHPARREQPHDRHRRPEPGRPAARTDLRAGGGDAAAAQRRGHRPRRLHRRGRHPARAGGAHRRRLRQGDASFGLQARWEAVRAKPAQDEAPTTAAGLVLEVTAAPEALAAEPEVQAFVATAIETADEIAGPAQGVVAVLVDGDERIRTLNRDWRGIDKATNVLSFCYPDRPRRSAATTRRHRDRF